jgi:hypothetical protein
VKKKKFHLETDSIKCFSQSKDGNQLEDMECTVDTWIARLILGVTVIFGFVFVSRLLLYDLQKENSYQKEITRSMLDLSMRKKGVKRFGKKSDMNWHIKVVHENI